MGKMVRLKEGGGNNVVFVISVRSVVRIQLYSCLSLHDSLAFIVLHMACCSSELIHSDVLSFSQGQINLLP
jgi:hypothetical protein